MFSRIGFAELGAMRTYVDIRNAGPVLRRRNEAFALLAPVVNLAFSIRRRLRLRSRSRQRANLRVSQLTSEQFLNLDRSHWAPTNRLVAWDSSGFVVKRHLTWPRGHQGQRQIYGLFDPHTDSLEGYVVAESATRIMVWDCQVNPATVDAPAAIAAIASSQPRTETVLVPTLPQSELAKDLVRGGFLERESVDVTEAETYLSAYWPSNSPHQKVLGDPGGWNIWLASRHY